MFASLLRKINGLTIIKMVAVALIFVFGILIRTQYFDQQSKDIYAYTKAIEDLVSGVNPYKWTIESFSNPDDPSNHGFSYLPGMLYVDTFFLYLSKITQIDFKYLWKVPVLLADIGVGVLLYLATKRRSLPIRLLATSMWFFNPYAYFRGGYTYFDPITIFLMLLSLYYLGKNNIKAGILYALSISTKTFPYLIFPVFVLTLLPTSKIQFKNILKTELAKFLLAGLSVAVIISLPFVTSWDNFLTYLNGSVFVHTGRFVQGRPFLFYISYYGKIELFQLIPFTVYTLLASFSGWLATLVLWIKNICRDKYVLSALSFILFYLFTPVLNRTYLIWFFPLFSIATTRLFKKWQFVVLANIALYAFSAWYLIQWEDGFHVVHP